MRYLAIIGLCLAAVCVQAENSMTLNVDRQKKFFIVSLASNPTTGYQWTVKNYDKSFLNLEKTYYEPEKTNLMGAGGHTQFKFVLRKGKEYPDKTTMLFQYARPWEKENEGTLKEVNVYFNQSGMPDTETKTQD
ncbi:protease inhibitor I42 family protein [Legionella israelensis]|uniref:protease inhibitor I42 family protein n=1 Tax=Legionella israelensis TaxID=454 RepID=UPI0011805E42|nr:protease inhibitor I42 family protein [Legionella israelensis]QDP72493.1 protease inhibitor I42 family protein [Legionella israelensis]